MVMDELSEDESAIRETEDAEVTELTADVSLAEQMLEDALRRLNVRQMQIAQRRQSLPKTQSLKRPNNLPTNEAAVNDESSSSKVPRTSIRDDDGGKCEEKTDSEVNTSLEILSGPVVKRVIENVDTTTEKSLPHPTAVANRANTESKTPDQPHRSTGSQMLTYPLAGFDTWRIVCLLSLYYAVILVNRYPISLQLHLVNELFFIRL